MIMFDFFAAAVGSAPVVLLLLFWELFPVDCGVHPICRESGTEAVDETTIDGAREKN